MKVEIWSDFVCPFCYIGKRRFEAALERFSHKQDVEVVYRSFELDPNASRESEHDNYDMLAAKYGMSREQAIATCENVAAQAREVGLEYKFDGMKPTNTFDAHRLAHYAAQHQKLPEMAERLLRAYFVETKPIGDPAVLAELAAEVGLDAGDAAQVLEGDAFAEEVRFDEQEAGRFGIRAVPFFVINRKYGVSGAQSSDVFLNALQKAWDEQGT